MGKGTGKHFPVFEKSGGWDILAPGAKLAARNVRDKEMTLWDPTTGQVVRHLATTDSATAFSPAGDALLTIGDGDKDAQVALWDVATGTKRWHRPRAADVVLSAVFSPDGSLIAWTAWGGEKEPVTYVIAAADGRDVRRIDALSGNGGDLTFSRDGRTLIGGGEFIRLCEVASGEAHGKLAGDQGYLHPLTLSHDGRRLASGGGDGTVLIWDVTGAHLRDKSRTAEALWEDLAGKDAVKAYRAVRQLADSPKETVEFLRARLKPVPIPDPKRIDQLIAALDANGFEERKQAKAELDSLAEIVEPALRTAAKTLASAEVGKQLADLLEKFAERRLKPTPAQLRPVRAVEVLEAVGTAEARDVLRTLAKGAPGASQTREARASLQRLERRSNNSGSK